MKNCCRRHEHDLKTVSGSGLCPRRFEKTPFAVNFLLPSHALDNEWNVCKKIISCRAR